MIYYITGGVRSGKSGYAQKLAESMHPNPVYMATARCWDSDFEARIQRHVRDRGDNWTTIEEELKPSKHHLEKRVVLLDCTTLWLTNLFMDHDSDLEKCLELFKQEIDVLAERETQYLVISNEIGMGVHASTDAGRKFTDLQGWANQYVAQKAEKAVFMVSGIPLTLK